MHAGPISPANGRVEGRQTVALAGLSWANTGSEPVYQYGGSTADRALGAGADGVSTSPLQHVPRAAEGEGVRVQQCSTVGCTRQAAFTTRTQPAWCSECIDDILRTGGLEAVEPFPGLKKDRLTRCMTCGVRAHYKLTYTAEKNRTRERTCRACYWKVWAAERRAEPWHEPRVYSREQIVRHLDANTGGRPGSDSPVVAGQRPAVSLVGRRVSSAGPCRGVERLAARPDRLGETVRGRARRPCATHQPAVTHGSMRVAPGPVAAHTA